jgi:hypothetical protein
MQKIPKKLQPYLWSNDIKDLNLSKDRAYIINHLLAYGGMEELTWLFTTYKKSAIKNTFLKQPIKIYSSSTLNFIKEILNLSNKKLDPYKYDKDLPRRIR